MGGKGVKRGSKLICNFWRNFEVKPGPVGSSIWDQEESWDVCLSDDKNKGKIGFLWFEPTCFKCLVKLWINEFWAWWCPFEVTVVPIESSLREEFFYNLPRSGKLDFAKFSGGKLRAHPGFWSSEVSSWKLEVRSWKCATRNEPCIQKTASTNPLIARSYLASRRFFNC